jgi:hypothetical protein
MTACRIFLFYSIFIILIIDGINNRTKMEIETNLDLIKRMGAQKKDKNWKFCS